MKEKISLLGIVCLTMTALASLEFCNFSGNGPCYPPKTTYFDCPLPGGGTISGISRIDIACTQNMEECRLIGLGSGNSGCEQLEPIQCLYTEVVLYCDGEIKAENRDTIAIPTRPGGGAACN